MVKIKVSDNKTTRTFYTRRDWKNGQKLYIYTPRSGPKLTGNWYTDPNYGHWSAQDYYREYDEQCMGRSRQKDSGELKLQSLVAEHNDALIDMANAGVKKVTFLESGVIVTEY